MKTRFAFFVSAFLAGASLLPIQSIHAQTNSLPTNVVQAVVLIVCGQHQGSGTVINGDKGYVLTNAHVVANIETGVPSDKCQVGFVADQKDEPVFYYNASINLWTYDEKRNQDFAILEIKEPISPLKLTKPFPFLKTNEFSQVGDSIKIIGYSGTDNDVPVIRSGKIEGFEKGFFQTDAQVRNGDSGGAAIDAENNLIGAPTRIVTLISGTTEKTSYEIVDIRAVMNWLDTYGINFHDKYFTHADETRYHQQAVFVSQENLGCEFVVKTPISSTLHCILPNEQRWVFPNEATFFSWFPDFKVVYNVSLDTISPFRIVRNVTLKPGTLVKSQTNPRVFVVVDTFGTMRWIPSEAKAIQIWGANWAHLVHDIPDEFYTNYTVGQPLDDISTATSSITTVSA
jgi:V8-like Glu-specific endopeptidase